jgi:hypothetical protein
MHGVHREVSAKASVPKGQHQEPAPERISGERTFHTILSRQPHRNALPGMNAKNTMKVLDRRGFLVREKTAKRRSTG